MSHQVEIQDPFQNAELHRRWESVYRGGGVVKRLDDRMMDRLLHLLQLRPGDRVLDAGCGTGEHTLRLAARGMNCLGVDVSHYAVATASERARDISPELSSRVEFLQVSIDDLGAAEGSFDAIHCRGVLMHIRDYRPALDAMCSVLKPGGRIAILENNCRSLETLLIRIMRHFRQSVSEMRTTPDGIEFHCPTDLDSPIWRIADLKTLRQHLAQRGVTVVARIAHEFFDLNRFPAGLLRNSVALLNLTWFDLHLLASLSHGNVLIGEKRAGY
jgi:ubiquinone/menaquinone biosynthesis C-methylase UbiE